MSSKSKGMSRQFLSYLLIGGGSVLLQFLLYMGALAWSNVTFATIFSFGVSSFFNAKANQKFTFSQTGSQGSDASKAAWIGTGILLLMGLAQYGIGNYCSLLGITPAAQSSIVAAGSSVLGGLRFVLMKFWLFAN